MHVKDYYAILKVSVGTDVMGIKKAFRALAMEYHPDKRSGNHLDEMYYREIQEAYLVLTDPKKREEYLYQRWLENAMGHRLDRALRAEDILQLFIKAEQYIAGADHFRMDKMILMNHLKDLFSDARLKTIMAENNPQMELCTLQMAHSAAQQMDTKGLEWLFEQFRNMLAKHPAEQSAWEASMRKKQKEKRMEDLKIPLVLVLTLIACWMIFKLGK